MSIPALIIAYSRHENVIRLLESLHAQGVKRVYLAIDGAKNSNNSLQTKVESSSQNLAKKLNLDLRIWRRTENLGPAVSVITAIDWFFSQETEGVIFEDDLVLSGDAIEFFSNSLSRYAFESKVFMISGSNYFEDTNQLGEGFATHYPVIWGWATWANRWRTYRDAIKCQERLRIPGSVTDKWFWEIGNRRCLAGIKDAWDIPLAAYQLTSRRLSILPPVNLISNIGADEFAGNTLLDQWPLNVPIKLLDRSKLMKRDSKPQTFVEAEIAAVDYLFKKKIYKIHVSRTLPSQISNLLDIIRYPYSTRKDHLLRRIERVIIPT